MNPLKFILTVFKNNTSGGNRFEISDGDKKQDWNIKLNGWGIFSYNTTGFNIDLKDGFYSIKWTDNERLQAYKADLLSTDEICIDITFDNKTIIATEETKGWYQFVDKVKSVLHSYACRRINLHQFDTDSGLV